MIVKCIALFDTQGNAVGSSPWLELGAEYSVLAIYENASGDRYYRIASQPDGNIGSLGLFPSKSFQIMDDNWPYAWVRESVNGETSIAPKSWQRVGFWEDLYDGDTQAIAVYEEEKDKILEGKH